MKQIVISILISLALVGGVIVLKPKNAEEINFVPFENVQMVEGKQVIELNVRGGYQPRKSVAKAGVPTILRFETSGNFDCSSAVRLPSLNISKFLPPTGLTDIDIGVPELGIFYGTCSMGMYPFEIDFQN